jgi:hypothetical protein
VAFLLAFGFFFVAVRFIRRWLELSIPWSLAIAGASTLVIYPALASLVDAAIVTVVSAVPVVPMLLLLAGLAGFFLGRWGSSNAGLPWRK